MHDVKLNRLIYRTDGKLARVILNRPEALNAFSLELVAELDAISQLIENDRMVATFFDPCHVTVRPDSAECAIRCAGRNNLGESDWCVLCKAHIYCIRRH